MKVLGWRVRAFSCIGVLCAGIMTAAQIETHGRPVSRAQVEATLTGRDTTAAHGTEEMPVWGPVFKGLDPSDARVSVRIGNLISYIESIQQK